MLKAPSHDFEIPQETAEIAKKACGKDNIYIKIREEIGVIYEDGEFAELFSDQGQPAKSAALLATVTVMQFMENLSDRQAANAVRARIDWKYLLGLELTDPGFDASVLSEFRSRLIEGSREMHLLNRLLEICQANKLLKRRGKQRTDSTHILAAVRDLNRLELLGETLRSTLESLATVDKLWLREQITPEWLDLYSKRFEDYRLPDSKTARDEFAVNIGMDGCTILNAIDHEDTPVYLREIPAVHILRQVWEQQFIINPDAEQPLRLRKEGEFLPSQDLIASPYDSEARFCRKRESEWVGYKVHLTETCDEDMPHLITHVETTLSTQPDQKALPDIHQALADKNLLPEQHLLDSIYVTSRTLVDSSQQHQVELIGPAPLNTTQRETNPDDIGLSQFVIDWNAQSVTCPQDKQSISWGYSMDRNKNDIVRVLFDLEDCRNCPLRSRCTSAEKTGRSLSFRTKDEYLALQLARERQQHSEFHQLYNTRAGIEGTISQAVRAFDLRRTRYVGLAKSHLQNIILSTALNLSRLATWFCGARPSKTRVSRLATLYAT